MVSKETAIDIAMAYREVETAESLLAEMTAAIAQHEVPDIRDAFGRRRDGLQLGVLTGNDSRRLFDVPWTLAKPIIEAYIAQQKAKISALTEKVRAEIG